MATHPQSTPALTQWLDTQPENVLTVLQTLLASGKMAPDAIETVLLDHYRNKLKKTKTSDALRVPEPSLENSPLYIDVGDRKVHVILSMAKPRVVLFGGLLSEDECDELIELANPRLKRARTVEHATGEARVNPQRSNDGMFFTKGENPLVARIEARIARLVNWPVDHAEGIQVLHYREGTQYRPHYDYFNPEAAGTQSIIARGGQRVGTVVMYLNDPEKGGGTGFPDIQLEVAPKRGNAVFFSYEVPRRSTLTLHSGMPVIKGEKWVATKWLREKALVRRSQSSAVPASKAAPETTDD